MSKSSTISTIFTIALFFNMNTYNAMQPEKKYVSRSIRITNKTDRIITIHRPISKCYNHVSSSSDLLYENETYLRFHDDLYTENALKLAVARSHETELILDFDKHAELTVDYKEKKDNKKIVTLIVKNNLGETIKQFTIRS